MLPILGLLLGAALALAGLLLLAIRQDYLLVMYWYDRGYFVLQATRGGRYQLISPAWIPLALLGFAAHLTATAPVLAVRWAHGRVRRMRRGVVAQL